jgi:uncharacterized membrane protein YbaN (DUF454 family)
MGIGTVLRIGLGVLLIAFGIAGLFLPFLQGVLMILLGVLLLKADSFGHAWRIVKKKLKRKNK